MGAYDDGARAYLGADLLPIPVRGKSVPAKGTTGYDGTVTAEKVEAWLNTDLDQRARDGRGVGLDNIGIRHQRTLAIDVDHGYGDKNGVDQLREYTAKLGLPPLPATWSSTARGDDSPSRQYVYRIAEDVTFKTKPCQAVELCTWHHRFTVVAPTIHPGTGTPYRWYLPGQDGAPPAWGAPTDAIPTAAGLPELPAAWFAALRGGVANADKSAVVIDLPDLFATFPAGEPDGLVAHLIRKWGDEATHVGHDEFKNALINALMVGREGHPGVPTLFAVLLDRYTRYLAVARPDAADAEVRSLVAACATIAQQKPVRPTTGFEGILLDEDNRAGNRSTAPVLDPVDDETWAAFLATFTEDPCSWMADNRTAWLREAMATRPNRDRAFRHHATAAFRDVIQGRYSAPRAVALLTEQHAGPDTDLTLRACLAAALSTLEGATR